MGVEIKLYLTFTPFCDHNGGYMKRDYGTQKTDLLKMRINPEEKAKIVKMARDSGLSLSDLIRRAIQALEEQKSA